jgi:Fanconi anemia group M protein
MPEFVTGKYIEDNAIENRDYQTQLVNAATTESTLIALPTGSGKTPVAVRAAMRRLEDKGGRILMVAPQTPLVHQHARTFKEMTTLPDHEIQIFTGSDTAPTQRKNIWNGDHGNVRPSVVIATPQVIEKDLVSGSYTLEDVTHLIVDECHRTTGDYAYVYIGERYNGNAENPLVTGMSASPGSERKSILGVCENLGITNIEIFSEDDEAISKYLGNTEVERRYIDMPDEVTEGADLLRKAYRDAQKELKKRGVLKSARKSQSLYPIKACMSDIQQLKNSSDSQKRSKGFQCLSYRAEAMKLHHAIDLVESQGIEQAKQYLIELNEDAQEDDASKADQRIVRNSNVQDAYTLFRDTTSTNPKLTELALEAREVTMDGGQMIVFTESRDTVQKILDFFDRGNGVDARKLIGQSNKENDPGMTQNDQKDVLLAFEDNEFDVLVATSVAEEGLDIPAVDLVMFYEPIPDGVRAIQRRGRTGRERDGRVVILIGKGTSDVGKDQIAQNQEDTMKKDMKALKDMEADLNEELQDAQQTLSEVGETGEVDDDAPTILVDHREGDSNIPKILKRQDDVRVEIKNNMEVGDFIVSDRVGVERKGPTDFLDTLVGERGFDQIKALVNNYDRAVVMVEADSPTDLYGRRGIPDEAIRSAITTMYADFEAEVLFTGGQEETAKQLATLARREQTERDTEVNAHGQKETSTLTEQQEYIVSSMEGIGPATAKNLLERFGGVRSVFTASKEELRGVDGIGKVRAEKLHDVVNAEYEPA